MIVIQNNDARKMAVDLFEQVHAARPQYIQARCNHCQKDILRPLIVRESDVQMVATLIKAIHSVCEDFDVAGKIMARLKAQANIAILSRKPVLSD